MMLDALQVHGLDPWVRHRLGDNSKTALATPQAVVRDGLCNSTLEPVAAYPDPDHRHSTILFQGGMLTCTSRQLLQTNIF